MHGFIGDRRDALRQQLLRQRLIRRQVQVGEQRQVLAEAVVFLLDGLLDLEHHVGLAPEVVGGIDDARALGDELLVGDRAAEARAFLDEHLMAVGHEFTHADRGDRDAIFVVLDLAGYADSHGSPH